MAKDFANRGKPTRAAGRSGGSAPRKKAAKPKKRAPARKPARKPGLFHGPSFSAGIVLGAGLVLLAAYAPELLQETMDRTTTTPPAQPKPTVEFQFDKRLRNQKIRANPENYSTGTASSADKPMEYLIQAASFQQRTDADTLRAQLLLSGLPATTNAVQVGDKPWYRVTVGPFPNNVESGRAMTKLRELDLDAFLIKREVAAAQ